MLTPPWRPAKGKTIEMIAKYKIQKFSRWVFVGILLAGWNASCSSTPITGEKTHKTKDLTLSYQDKSRAGERVNDMTLQHPVSLNGEEVLHHLTSLKYEGNALMSKKNFVFHREDLYKIQPLLTRALNGLKPNLVLGYELKAKGGTTSGIVFASNNRLHWRFDEIQGLPYTASRDQRGLRGTAWRLIPRKGQKLYVSSSLLGSKSLSNWIIAKLKMPGKAPSLKKEEKKKNPEQATPKSAAPVNSNTLEEKLEFLKNLHEKGLIDDQEYQQKRKDLLDKYL